MRACLYRKDLIVLSVFTVLPSGQFCLYPKTSGSSSWAFGLYCHPQRPFSQQTYTMTNFSKSNTY